MPVLSESELPEKLKASWHKAMAAMQTKNYAYACQLYQVIVRECPEFLMARQLARRAAIAKGSGKKKFFGMTLSTASISAVKLQSLVKKDPKAAMDEIEKALEDEPYNAQLNMCLHDAALAMELPEIAEFALETIADSGPKDTKIFHDLAKLYMKNGKPGKAVETYDRALLVDPNDLIAIKGGKDAAAALSMQRGGWEKENTDYRDLIKDIEATKTLAEESRIVRDKDTIEALLRDLHPKVEADPQNLDLARRIAELYDQKEDNENALNWYRYADELSKHTDPGLVRKVSDLSIKQYEASIVAFEKYIAENPQAEGIEDSRKQLEAMRRERAKLMLDAAQKRVDRNPTDLLARYELGDILVQAGHCRRAISEFQKARNNPAVRLRATNLLGRCYTELEMYDLAVDILTSALEDMQQMDAVKKATLYDLGLVYGKMNEREKSLEAFKQIYAVDYEYRDVADRVEKSYSRA